MTHTVDREQKSIARPYQAINRAHSGLVDPPVLIRPKRVHPRDYPDISTPDGVRHLIRMMGLQVDARRLEDITHIRALSKTFTNGKFTSSAYREVLPSADELFQIACDPGPRLAGLRFRCARQMARRSYAEAAAIVFPGKIGMGSISNIQHYEKGVITIDHEEMRRAGKDFHLENPNWLANGCDNPAIIGPEVITESRSHFLRRNRGRITDQELIDLFTKWREIDGHHFKLWVSRYRKNLHMITYTNGFFSSINRPELDSYRQSIVGSRVPQWLSDYNMAAENCMLIATACDGDQYENGELDPVEVVGNYLEFHLLKHSQRLIDALTWLPYIPLVLRYLSKTTIANLSKSSWSL